MFKPAVDCVDGNTYPDKAFKGIGITYLTDLQNGSHGGRKLVHAKDVFDHQWMGAQEKKYHALLHVLKKLSSH